ncbi:hypothetical protein LXL04_021211 [Taraxacum kok-saghyz]
MTGLSFQGWSKFPIKFNTDSISNPNGKPWRIPEEMNAKTVDQQCKIDEEASKLAEQEGHLNDLRDEIKYKPVWIKKAKRYIKNVVVFVNRYSFKLDNEEDISNFVVAIIMAAFN